jgi:CheY-like chemotaxis protein/signal transduction histidine kinase
MSDQVDVTQQELDLLAQASEDMALECLPALLESAQAPNLHGEQYGEVFQAMGERLTALGQACGFVGVKWIAQRLQAIGPALQRQAPDGDKSDAIVPLLVMLPQALQAYFTQPDEGRHAQELIEQCLEPLALHTGTGLDVSPGTIHRVVIVDQRIRLDLEQIQLRAEDLLAPGQLAHDPQLLEVLELELGQLAGRLVGYATQADAAFNDEQLDELRRIAHTLKGSANTAGLRFVAVMAHLLEEWLLIHPGAEDHRSGASSNGGGKVMLSPWCHAIKLSVAAAMRSQPVPPAAIAAYRSLYTVLVGEPPAELVQTDNQDPGNIEAPENFKSVPPDEAARLPSQSAGLAPAASSIAGPGGVLERQGALAQHLAKAQAELGSLQALRGASRTATDRLAMLSTELQTLADRQRVLLRTGAVALNLEQQQGELDQIARRVDELVQDQRQTLASFDEHLWNLREATESLHTEQQLAYDALWSAQAIDLEQLGARLERVVRQVSHATSKPARLVLQASGVRIPRTDLDALIEVLGHLLRNAVDHGIEPAAERSQLGKPVEGSVRVLAKSSHAGITLEVSDDGRGLNLPAIEQRARALGWLGADEAAPEATSLAQWIFEPGFSTQPSSNLWSGRGIGLDVVRSMVLAHAGHVELILPNRFVVFWPAPGQQIAVLTVPLPGGHIALFAPQLQEVLDAWPEDEPAAPPGAIIDVVNRIKLPQFDDSQQSADTRDAARDAGRPEGLLLRLEGLPWVRVPDLGSALRVPLYPLPVWAAQGPGLMGACVMGDGKVLMVLHLGLWLQAGAPLLGARAGESPHTVQAGSASDPRPTVLVVDDAVVVRQQTARYMQDCGWRVQQAADGLEALRMIEQRIPDLILSDLEMPRCNGMELASRLRQRPATSAVPLIMITSRSGAALRAQAQSSGVDEVLTKPFDELALQQAIMRLAPLPSQATIG